MTLTNYILRDDNDDDVRFVLAKHTPSRSESKDWLARNEDNVS
jgi:hypothetical protein